jgi:hypothetical protein
LDPQNLIYVVQRAISTEWKRAPETDSDECYMYMRTDFVIEETDAIVKAYNVNVNSAVAYYGA